MPRPANAAGDPEVPAKIETEGAVVLSADRLFRLLTYASGDELKIDVKEGQSAGSLDMKQRRTTSLDCPSITRL
jgi:hypothetical protein